MVCTNYVKLFLCLGNFIQQYQIYLFGELKPEILHIFLWRILKYLLVIFKSDPTLFPLPVLDFCHVFCVFLGTIYLCRHSAQYFVFSDAIINENYDYLKGFLEDLAPPERSSLIQDWETSGLVYLDYIQVIEMLHHVQQVPQFFKPLPGFPFPWPLETSKGLSTT